MRNLAQPPKRHDENGDNKKYDAWNYLSSMIHKHLDYLTVDYDYLS